MWLWILVGVVIIWALSLSFTVDRDKRKEKQIHDKRLADERRLRQNAKSDEMMQTELEKAKFFYWYAIYSEKRWY